ncbi:unnamed protein product [Caenorhabditis bovis]|uniref:Uncharacterized protein n=1 Tax=Caenorhabditis bovis TaxID=2654633 RepID=A0A8S1F2F2_9PELO|nr:unnamed protein product [Caenorhabditis bovis]
MQPLTLLVFSLLVADSIALFWNLLGLGCNCCMCAPPRSPHNIANIMYQTHPQNYLVGPPSPPSPPPPPPAPFDYSTSYTGNIPMVSGYALQEHVYSDPLPQLFQPGPPSAMPNSQEDLHLEDTSPPSPQRLINSLENELNAHRYEPTQGLEEFIPIETGNGPDLADQEPANLPPSVRAKISHEPFDSTNTIFRNR